MGNKKNEQDTDYPVWSYWQIKFWKRWMSGYFRVQYPSVNLGIGAALEALFCWISYYYCLFDGAVFHRFSHGTWVWSFHLLEEIEHTHISVPEMRKDMSLFMRVFTWFIFDFVV